VVSLRLWLAGSPWRLSGGWLLLAGLIAAAGQDAWRRPYLPALLALVLAEVLWGGLWWQLVPSHHWPLHRARRRPALPYVQPASPAGRLLGWPEPGAAAAVLRAGLPLAGLAALLAVLVGAQALALTGAVLLIVLLAMAARQAGLAGLTGWLFVLVTATLPFALGVFLRGQWPPAPQGPFLLGLGLGFSLLARSLAPGVIDTPGSRLGRLLVAAGGFVAIIALFLAGGRLLAAGVVGLLAVAPLLILARADGREPAAAQPWMLATVLVSSAGLGFGIG
jgi:hypothetical protein